MNYENWLTEDLIAEIMDIRARRDARDEHIEEEIERELVKRGYNWQTLKKEEV